MYLVQQRSATMISYLALRLFFDKNMILGYVRARRTV